MALQQIKHRFTVAVLFECDVPYEQSGIAMRVALEKATEARANLSYANLSDANLSGADLSDADLSGANLSGANLSYANLSDANLSGANLSGADIDGEQITVAPLSLYGLLWSVLITDGYMRIGCQRYKHANWESFTDGQISDMESRAPEFWAQWKAPLLAMCAAHAASVDEHAAQEVAA